MTGTASTGQRSRVRLDGQRRPTGSAPAASRPLLGAIPPCDLEETVMRCHRAHLPMRHMSGCSGTGTATGTGGGR
jgi:hypothetical protein